MSDPHADPAPHSTADPAATGHAPAGGHATTGAHATSDAHGGDAHGSGGEEHDHGEALGPVDWVAWGTGVVGLLIGLGTALAFAIATNRLG